jgi:hypothetical protein
MGNPLLFVQDDAVRIILDEDEGPHRMEIGTLANILDNWEHTFV